MKIHSRAHVYPHQAAAGSTCPARRGSLAPQHTPCEKEGQRSSSADDFTASLKISLWRSRRSRSRAQRRVVARRAGRARHSTARRALSLPAHSLARRCPFPPGPAPGAGSHRRSPRSQQFWPPLHGGAPRRAPLSPARPRRAMTRPARRGPGRRAARAAPSPLCRGSWAPLAGSPPSSRPPVRTPTRRASQASQS